MKGIIYKYTSPSGKCYIGQTVNENKRKYEHRYNAYYEEGKDYENPFYRAIRKYGWDSFSYEVLNTVYSENIEELTNKLDSLEIYYIGQYDSYKNGYNQTIGGHGLRGNNHPSYGTKLSEDHKKKLKDSVSKQVSQYTLSGKYIGSYDSAAQASLVTNADSSGIIAVCRGKQHTAGGFQWRYGCKEDNIGEVVYEKPTVKKKYGKENPKSKPVYQYTLDYELVRIWESALQAERELGYSSTYISRVCNNKQPFYGKRGQDKYIWRFTPIEYSKDK